MVERALVLNIVINCAFQMPIPLARAWLRQEGLEKALTPGEQRYLEEVERGLDPEAQGHQLQVEALWTLLWALSLVPALDFGSYCGDELSGLLPDLRRSESSRGFRTRAHLRSPEELYQRLDLAYCLSWGIAEANLTRSPLPGRVDQYVVRERRRALEWLHGGDWDAPRTDT